MKKILFVLLLFFAMILCSCSKESPVDDFLYDMQDGEIIITGYKGTELEIYIPSKINDRPVTTIGENAFQDYDMEHITMPDSVTLISKYAFNGCENLTSIKFSSNLEKISSGAFWGCSGLTEISFNNSLQTIESNAFYDCTSLNKVTLPESLQYLGEDAFDSCDSLAYLRIPDDTKLEIAVRDQQAGYVGVVKQFISPVGGSSIVSYFDESLDSNVGNKEFEELSTKIVVTEGSYAHSQVRSYSQYGLVIEVEGSKSNSDDINTKEADTSKEDLDSNNEESDTDIKEVRATIEGAGYDSPEDSILAYAEALKTSDLSKILATFAVESYVDNFDMAAYIEEFPSVSLGSNMYWGKWDAFTEDIGLLNRQNDIVKVLSNLCTTVCLGYDYINEHAASIHMQSTEEREDFLNKLSGDGWERMLVTVEYTDEFIYVQELIPNKSFALSILSSAKAFGCDEIVPLAMKVTIAGTEYYLCMDVARYGNKWYNFRPGYSTQLYHIPVYAGGIVPVEWVESQG